MITVSPRIGALLSRVAETPDIEVALWKVLSEYIDLKSAQLSQQIAVSSRSGACLLQSFPFVSKRGGWARMPIRTKLKRTSGNGKRLRLSDYVT